MGEPVHRRLTIPGQSATEDRLIAMVAALLSEVAVLRERLDTVERIAERREAIDRAEIEVFVADPAAQAERDAARRRLIDKVLGPLRDGLRQAADEEESR